MKEFICICCPQGCRLKVDEEKNYEVSGFTCKRGKEYGLSEATNPVRVVTSTVEISGAEISKCPVKTDHAIPKEKIFDICEAIKEIKVKAPVEIGQVVLSNAAGTDAKIVVTKKITAKGRNS